MENRQRQTYPLLCKLGGAVLYILQRSSGCHRQLKVLSVRLVIRPKIGHLNLNCITEVYGGIHKETVLLEGALKFKTLTVMHV